MLTVPVAIQYSDPVRLDPRSIRPDPSTIQVTRIKRLAAKAVMAENQHTPTDSLRNIEEMIRTLDKLVQPRDPDEPVLYNRQIQDHFEELHRAVAACGKPVGSRMQLRLTQSEDSSSDELEAASEIEKMDPDQLKYRRVNTLPRDLADPLQGILDCVEDASFSQLRTGLCELDSTTKQYNRVKRAMIEGELKRVD
ncbi:hypothetical protein GE09DRAFT_1067840 [Coniochaeta sp. 2T2.1]|nr:hypothetical protein GE09DRAFT_1067840 [Coniochaeta sp. 2T2.1]